MFLENGPEDSYYKRVRDGLKFVLMGCDHDFDGCFCVSMGTNVSTDYDAAVNVRSGGLNRTAKIRNWLRASLTWALPKPTSRPMPLWKTA